MPLQDLREKLWQSYGDLFLKVYWPSIKLSQTVFKGQEISRIIFFTWLLLTFALCLGLSLIKSPQIRKLYSTVLGLLCAFYCFGVGYLAIIFQFIAFYAVNLVLPRNLACTVSLLFIIATHTFILYTDWSTGRGLVNTNFLVIFQINFQKLHMTIGNYSDGGHLDSGSKSLTSHEKRHALKEFPSLLEWTTYMVSIGQITGPSSEFLKVSDYFNVVGDYAKMRPFSNFTAAFKRFVQWLLVVGAFIALSSQFKVKYLGSEDLYDAPLLTKAGLLFGTIIER